MTVENKRLDKVMMRERFSRLRNTIAEELRLEGSASASRRLAEWAEEKACRSVMAYVSFRSELSIKDFIEWSWKKGIEVVVPRCVPATRSMTLHALKHWDELALGAYGILEPDPARTAALPSDFLPDTIIVPGLAFDRSGGRLGYGGGYYDRFAEAANRLVESRKKKLLWIGAGFEAQLVERIPVDHHDLRLDGMITEKAMHLFHGIHQP